MYIVLIESTGSSKSMVNTRRARKSTRPNKFSMYDALSQLTSPVLYSWRPVASRKSFLFLAFSPTQHTNWTSTIRHVFFLFPLNPFQNKQGPPLHPHVPRTGGGGGKAPTSRQAGAGKGKGKKGKKGKKDQYDLIVNIDLVSITEYPSFIKCSDQFESREFIP